MLTKLETYLSHPLARNLNLDSPEAIQIHSRIIHEKPFLRQIYEGWYTSISRLLPDDIGGPIVEVGSGGGFLTDFIPDLLTSEIRQVPTVHIVLDGQCLPFRKASLRAIVMTTVLHHFPDVKSFLTECAYCIRPGGRIIMVEPWATRWSRLIFRYLHGEPFNPEAKDWNFPRGGPLSQANAALPWIVFARDREKFEREFPQWYIKEIKLREPFCYLLSGGVSLRSFMPGCLFGMWRRIEDLLHPWIRSWAMFATIVLLRKG